MQNKEIKEDEFIRSLVMKGEYNPELLNLSILRDEKSFSSCAARIEHIHLYCKNACIEEYM